MEEDYSIVKKILDKDGIKMERIDKNKYVLSFSVSSEKLYLKKIIDFSILKLLYELNKDIFDDFYFTQENEGANVYFLIKHFFSDFGFPQKYLSLNVEKVEDEKNKTLVFVCQDDKSGFFEKGDQLNTEIIQFKCKFFNDHYAELESTIFFDKNTEIPAFVEKMAGVLIGKIVFKVKQFIENTTTL